MTIVRIVEADGTPLASERRKLTNTHKGQQATTHNLPIIPEDKQCSYTDCTEGHYGGSDLCKRHSDLAWYQSLGRTK